MSLAARACVGTVAAAFLTLPAAALALQTSGPPSFAQLAGVQGCVVQEGTEENPGCATARGLGNVTGVALSPDERHLYVTAAGGLQQFGSGSVVAFVRDPESGALSSVGCVSNSGDDGRTGTEGFCSDGDALSGAADLAVSPDGRFVYVVSRASSGVAWLERDPATGALTQRGCLKEVPRGDRCGATSGLWGAAGVAVSPDGRHVYVAASVDGVLLTFARDPGSGALTFAGCVSDDGSDGRCENGTGLAGATSVVVSPDGGAVYATAFGGAVTGYARDVATGLLTPQACLLDDAVPGSPCTAAPALAGATALAVSPDSRQLLVASSEDSALGVFGRDPASGALTPARCYRNEEPQGDDRETPPEEEPDSARAAETSGCQSAKALAFASDVAVSRDGRAVFTAGNGDFLAAFRRDPSTGALEQFACAEDRPTYKSCADARGLNGATDLAVSDDGRNLYVASGVGPGAVAVFAASIAILTRAARVSTAGTIAIRLACPAARRSSCQGRLAARQTGSGAHYRIRPGAVAGVTVRLGRSVRRRVRSRGRAAMLLLASDTRRLTDPTSRHIVVTRR
jgi:6-phosphogluconolactonase (cycloisomerase 2 family)